jgi:hypothetical protein
MIKIEEIVSMIGDELFSWRIRLSPLSITPANKDLNPAVSKALDSRLRGNENLFMSLIAGVLLKRPENHKSVDGCIRLLRSLELARRLTLNERGYL